MDFMNKTMNENVRNAAHTVANTTPNQILHGIGTLIKWYVIGMGVLIGSAIAILYLFWWLIATHNTFAVICVIIGFFFIPAILQLIKSTIRKDKH